MEIFFKSGRLQKICASKKAMVLKLGPRIADVLGQRLSEIEAAETLEDMRSLPAARCHELSQDRKGQLALDLAGLKRLIFRPNHERVPQKPDGGLDWSRVTRILVLEIVDYH